MRDDIIELIKYLAFICVPLFTLIIWVLTFLAFRRRLKIAEGNRTLTLEETLKYAFSPLLAAAIGIFELLYSIFRKFSIIFIILLFPFWGILAVLFLLWLVLPELIDRLLRNLGKWGEQIMKSIETFPQRTDQRFKSSRALLLGDLMLFLTNSPLNRLITSRKAIRGLEVLGFQPKAISILKSAALDPSKALPIRLNAIRSLGRMNCKDDLLDIARQHRIEPEIAQHITAWLQENGNFAEYLLAWRLLGRHQLPEVRLEAARKLHLEGVIPDAQRILLHLAESRNNSEDIRIQAVEELGYISQSTGDLKVLEEMAQPGQPASLQLSALEALARSGQKQINVAKICTFLDTSQPVPVRLHAIRSLGRLGQRFELSMISKNNHLSAEERLEACLALEKSGFELVALVCLLNLALDQGVPIPGRRKILEELGEFGPNVLTQQDYPSFQRRRGLLVSQGQNEETPAEVRLGIAQVLEMWNCEKDAGALYTLLTNSKTVEKSIRSQASTALKKLSIRLA